MAPWVREAEGGPERYGKVPCDPLGQLLRDHLEDLPLDRHGAWPCDRLAELPREQQQDVMSHRSEQRDQHDHQAAAPRHRHECPRDRQNCLSREPRENVLRGHSEQRAPLYRQYVVPGDLHVDAPRDHHGMMPSCPHGKTSGDHQ